MGDRTQINMDEMPIELKFPTFNWEMIVLMREVQPVCTPRKPIRSSFSSGQIGMDLSRSTDDTSEKDKEGCCFIQSLSPMVNRLMFYHYHF